MKEKFVNNLKEGENFEDIFVIFDVKDEVILGDKSGKIPALFKEKEELKRGDFVKIRGRVFKENNKLKIEVEEFKKVTEKEIDIKDFIKVTEKSIDGMWEEFRKIAGEVKNPYLRELLSRIFKDKEIVDKFKKSPGASKMHHQWMGGLLEHTLNVCRACLKIAELYPKLDKDLLLTGAILHDIGKIKTYDLLPEIKINEEELMISHIVAGYEIVKEKIKEIKDFPDDLAQKLLHLILSHHGERKWGSPVEPRLPEAKVLHYLDILDAHI